MSCATRVEVSARSSPLRDVEPTHVLLEESLRKVLEVTLGEGDRRGDGELSGDVGRDLDVLAELAGLALDLDVVDEELLVRSGVEDLVVGGSRIVCARKAKSASARPHEEQRDAPTMYFWGAALAAGLPPTDFLAAELTT